MQFLLDRDGADMLSTLMEHEAVTQIGGYNVSRAEVKGQQYEPAVFSVECSAATKEEDDETEFTLMEVVGALAVGLVFGVICVLCIAFGCMRCRGYQLTPTNAYDDKQYRLMGNQAL